MDDEEATCEPCVSEAIVSALLPLVRAWREAERRIDQENDPARMWAEAGGMP